MTRRGWLRWLAPRRPVPPPALPRPEGEGPLVWLRLGTDYDDGDAPTAPQAVVQLLAQLRRRGLTVALSRETGPVAEISTRGVAAIPDPAQATQGALSDRCEAWLDALSPDVVLLLGGPLPDVLIETASDRAIPVILAEARLSEQRFRLLGGRDRLRRLSYFLAQDLDSVRQARSRGLDRRRIQMTGPITQSRPPLRHLEAERSSMAEALQGRQCWLAAGVQPEEEDAVIAAHLALLGYSHRAVLILLPDEPARGPALAARIEAAGLIAAQRAEDDDITAEVSVYIADDPFELGLWYRLAPVTFLGGTLVATQCGERDPFEPAALGSAIIHGPFDGPFAAELSQLDGAGAAMRIESAEALGAAVVALSAPDHAAALARNAWAVSTGGIGVAARIADVVKSYARRAMALGRKGA